MIDDQGLDAHKLRPVGHLLHGQVIGKGRVVRAAAQDVEIPAELPRETAEKLQGLKELKTAVEFDYAVYGKGSF